MAVRVQADDFDISTEVAALTAGRTDIGAIVTFTGTVRDQGGGQAVSAMTLEHYPDMTVKELDSVEKQALARWPITASLIIHRYGRLQAGDNIVLVITASAHRQAAFESAAFLMDYLKTSAPFWKSEEGPGGDARWVGARGEDDAASARWDMPDNGDADGDGGD
jgi:molybdopterin synthase catalytic subunit